MPYYLIFDILILVVLVVFALLGYYRGLVLSLCGLLAVLVALLGASYVARTVSPMVAQALEPRFAAAIEERLNESIQDSIYHPDADAPSETTPPADSTDADAPLFQMQDVLNVLKDMGFYQSIIDTINEALENRMTEVAATAAAQVAAAIAQSVAYALLYVVSFAVILLIWKLISHALDLVARFPGLHFLNKTLGALFGLVKACIILFIAAWLLQFSGQLIPEETVEKTYLLQFFMTTNPFSLLSGVS